VTVVLAHGSGLDELAIFLFPVVIGTGFWLLTRQRRGAAESDEEPAPVQIASSAPRPVAPAPDPEDEPGLTNARVSPFHKMIARPPPSPSPPPSSQAAQAAQPVSRKPTLRSVSGSSVGDGAGESSVSSS
jgi:hypothetical protein